MEILATLFLIVWFLSTIGFFVGMLNPKWVLRRKELATRRKVAMVYGLFCFISFVIGVMLISEDSERSQSAGTTATQREVADAQDNKMRESTILAKMFKKKGPGQDPVKYQMPRDVYDIDKDPAITKILPDGLIYTVKTDNAVLLAMDQKTKLADLTKGRQLYFDNAVRRFQDHPYIWVQTLDEKLAGWLHVKEVGYLPSK